MTRPWLLLNQVGIFFHPSIFTNSTIRVDSVLGWNAEQSQHSNLTPSRGAAKKETVLLRTFQQSLNWFLQVTLPGFCKLCLVFSSHLPLLVLVSKKRGSLFVLVLSALKDFLQGYLPDTTRYKKDFICKAFLSKIHLQNSSVSPFFVLFFPIFSGVFFLQY